MKAIISIILIAASIAFFVFCTKPQWTELKENRLEVEKLNIAQENAKKLKARIDGLSKIRSSITDQDHEKIKKMIQLEQIILLIKYSLLLL